MSNYSFAPRSEEALQAAREWYEADPLAADVRGVTLDALRAVKDVVNENATQETYTALRTATVYLGALGVRQNMHVAPQPGDTSESVMPGPRHTAQLIASQALRLVKDSFSVGEPNSTTPGAPDILMQAAMYTEALGGELSPEERTALTNFNIDTQRIVPLDQ